MRDIVPRSTPATNKENVAKGNKSSASSTVRAGVKGTITPVLNTKVGITTVTTPQSSKPIDGGQYVIPHRANNPLKMASNAPFPIRKTPGNFKEQSDVTPGQTKRTAKAYNATPFRNTPGSATPQHQNRAGSTPVTRKMTPSGVQSAHKMTTTPVSTKLTVISESMQQSSANVTLKPESKPEESHVTVAVRIRPINQRERKEDPAVVVEANEEGLVSVTTAENSCTSYQYDHCFGPTSSQSDLFRALVHPLLSKALEGYNACLFSYGQTGSGKTYSMMGVESADTSRSNISRDAGIIPRFGFSLFERLARGMEVYVEVSYFEIYNERIRDLLVDDNIKGPKPSLQVREHPQLGFYVEGLTSQSVASFDKLQDWLRLGMKKRAIAASAMNDKSSRSHCIFSVTLTHRRGSEARRSKVHLVDLAGSERLVSTCATGDRLREGVSINTSLLTLGKVITALTEKQSYVPYRESLLTRLLSDSLGGSARTVMLATVSPARLYAEETLATLRYACQARAIVNRPHIQQAASSVTSNRQLQEELERLRVARKEYEQRGAGQELVALHAELAAVKQQLEIERSTWETRVNASEMACARQTSELTKRGVAECSTMAGLRLLTPDPSLSLLFGLPGPTCPRKVLGSRQPPADIELQGPLVAEKHCVLEWRDGVVWLLLEDPSSECYVNGSLVDQDVPLADGDRLALGGEFFLLVQLEPGCITAVDHEFARMELSLAQNAKLNRELTEAKERAIFQLEKMKEQMEQIGADKKAAECELEMVRREQKQMVEALQAEVREGRKRMEVAQANLDLSVLPFTSSLLQELSNLEPFWDAGAGLDLHEMRCLVREATQRCHRLGLHYKFSQIQQALEEFQPGKSALQPCIKVRKPDQQFAICSPYTFLTILNTLRDCENEGLEVNSVYELMTELVWELEDEPQIAEASFEASVTVDVTPFRRHLLSLSLTVHEEDENESKENIEKYLGVLQETMTKIQLLGSSQQHLQPYLTNLKTAICQLEREVLHPHLESFHNSEPSTISHGSLQNIEDSYNNISDASSHDDSQPSVISLEKSDAGAQERSTESRASTIDQALYKLKRSDVPSEPSIASSVSTVLHSPPSISAQPTKSNMRVLSLPDGLGLPGKQVHFKLRKPSQC